MNPSESGKYPVAPASGQAAVKAAGTADENRKKLQDWSEKSKYKSISFWVRPNVVASGDESIAEVANALTNFEQEKSTGTLKHDDKLVK
jgi:hypothetical protein